MKKDAKRAVGAKFTRSSFFRPTQMSVAMAHAGIIPAPHIIKEVGVSIFAPSVRL